MTRLICLSLLTMALHLQAAATTVWEGTKVFSSWSDVLNIAGSKFSQVQADDVVLFSITAFDNGNTADFWRQFLNEAGIVTR